jgi:phage FluMu protein gp41
VQPNQYDANDHPVRADANTAPTKLFISYKRSAPSDEKLAHAIRNGFGAMGHEVFIDVGMKIGTDWVAEIERRIDWCDFLIVLLSELAVESEMVQAEVRLAHQRRRHDGRPAILPVRVNYKGALGYELDAYLGRIQYIIWSNDGDTARVFEELQKSLAEFNPQSLDSTPSLDELDLSAPRQRSRDRRRPQAAGDPRVLLPPGGTIKLEDDFYFRREADEHIEKIAKLRGQTLVIKAPRQMGKSSLLIRYLAACKAADKQFAFIDFQSFSEADLSQLSALTRRIAQILLRALKRKEDKDLTFASQLDFTYFIEDNILRTLGAPIVIAMDEVDRLLGRPYQSEFFSMLRHWHNERAQPSSVWECVDLAMVIATEPYLLIPQADRSPFNVTPAIELGPFRRTHLDQINVAYGTPLTNFELDQLYELLSGQPYLTRLAFYRLISSEDFSFESLMAHSANSDGPFGEHLRSRLFLLQQQGDMLGVMRRVITKSAELDHDAFYRLHAAGLVQRRGKETVPSNLLYARFFKRL